MRAVVYLMLLGAAVAAVWQGGRRVGQLVMVETRGDRVGLRQWLAQEKQWRVIELPPSLVLPIAQGYGTYRVGALVGLDRLEKRRGQLVVTGLQEALGIALDGDYQDLNWGIRLRLWLESRGRQETVKWEEVVPVTFVMGPDGGESLQVSEADMDKFSSRFLADEAVRAEGIKVTILNATGRTGLARRVARIVTNMGLVVVKLGETDPNEKSRLLVNRDKQKSISAQKLKNLLQVGRVEVGDTSEHRADVAVFIGADYGLKVGE